MMTDLNMFVSVFDTENSSVKNVTKRIFKEVNEI